MIKKHMFLEILLFTFLSISCNKHNPKAIINGAGATFPFPLYSVWSYNYNQQTHIQVNYQAIGSGAGIAQIKQKTVDFGASDKPLKLKELEKYGLIQFPMVMGGVVPVVNIEGITNGQLKLSGEVLAEIFLGEIKKWNNTKITTLNPKLKLPNTNINVIYRADGSGTTWIFTNYLSKVSTKWKNKIGIGKSVKWQVGIGGKGNDGVAGIMKKIKNSIGYVEYAYSVQTKLPAISLKNKNGKFVKPSINGFKDAASNANWEKSKGFYLVLTNQAGEKSWPITGATFILIYKNNKDKTKLINMLKYFDWCYKNKNQAEKLNYIPMPNTVVSLVKKLWKTQIKVKGKTVWK